MVGSMAESRRGVEVAESSHLTFVLQAKRRLSP